MLTSCARVNVFGERCRRAGVFNAVRFPSGSPSSPQEERAGDAMSQLVADVARWATDVVYSFGYPGVFVLMVLSNVYLPIPSQLVLPLSGFLVGQERFSFSLVLLASTAGAVVGTLLLYAPGRWLGEETLRRFLKRYG